MKFNSSSKLLVEVNRSPAEPSSMPDENFFGKWDAKSKTWIQSGEINYGHSPALARVEQAVKKQDYSTASEELFKYYQKREGIQTYWHDWINQNSEAAELLLDWILTLSGETYVTTIKVNNSYEIVEGDVTKPVLNAFADAQDDISFILMARHKGEQLVAFNSREHKEHPPCLKIVINGIEHLLPAVKDTYIHAGQADSNFGAETEMFVKDEGAPYNKETKKSYLQFSISGLRGEVSSAVLKLYGKTYH